MAIDDLIDSEIGVAVAATAAAVSPRARNLIRQGAVYGLAGAMKAGDVVYGAVRGAASGVSGNGSSTSRSHASSGSRTSSGSRSTSSSPSTSRSRSTRRSTSGSGASSRSSGSRRTTRRRNG